MIRSKRALLGRFSKGSAEPFENRPQKAHMALAIKLAKKGLSHTSPNPMVGAVIVKDGTVIGMGWHPYFGGPHGEIQAIQNAVAQGNSPQGAELYVTLEPCCHQGKTPPCTEAIIQAGISKVYIGQVDPNPLVSGKGAERLRRAGIEVEMGLLEDRCQNLNKIFNYYIQTQCPFITLKTAMSVDAKTSDGQGRSQWITSSPARVHGRGLRAEHRAILIGRGTLEKDNPQLTARMDGCRDPIRILVDRQLQSDLSFQLFQNLDKSEVWVYCEEGAPLHRMKAFEELGILVIPCKAPLNLSDVFQNAGSRGIDSILVEGGPTMIGLALATGMANELYTYTAPMLLGGVTSNPMIAGWQAESLEKAQQLKLLESRKIGEDLMLRWSICPSESQFPEISQGSRRSSPCSQA